MTVRITPALGYAHGHIETLLIQLGINPPTPRRADGLVIMDLSEAQVAAFQLKGNAHRIERLPDAPVEAAAAPQAPVIEMPKPVEHSSVTDDTRPTSVEVPTLQHLKEAGYSHKAAKHLVARQKKLAQVKDGNTIESFSE